MERQRRRDRVPKSATAATEIRAWIGVCSPVLIAAVQLVTVLKGR